MESQKALKSRSFWRWSFLFIGVIAFLVTLLNTFELGIFSIPSSNHTIYLGNWSRLPYNFGVWHEAAAVGWGGNPIWDNRRARMVPDLTAHHLHRGLTMAQVRKLMGQPDGESECEQHYRLLFAPRPDQQLITHICYGTSEPTLILFYQHGKLVKHSIQ